MNEIKESNDLKSLVVAKEEKKETDFIKFKRYFMPNEVSKRVDCEYGRLVCSFENSLKPECSIPSNLEYTISSLKKDSIVLDLIDDNVLKRIETSNYRIVTHVSCSEYIDWLYFDDLKSGLENLLNWELHFIKKHKIQKIEKNAKLNYSKIAKVNIIFEDMLIEINSKQYLTKFTSYDHQSIRDHYHTWCCEEQDDDAIELLLESSELFRYLDKDTIRDLDSWRKYYFSAKILCNNFEIMDISHHMKGLGGLLMFERYLKKKCIDWAGQKYENSFGDSFKYDCVEIAFEL